MIDWFDDIAGFVTACTEIQPLTRAINAVLEGQETVRGYCAVCRRSTRFTVNMGPMLGTHPSLREGLACHGCGLNNRSRLLLAALRESLAGKQDPTGAVLEATTPLFARLVPEFPRATGSEYFGPEVPPGSIRKHGPRRVRNESILALTYASGSLDFVLHNDVLEHVPDTARAMRECARVLRPGGVCVFTMPFFPFRESTLVRGILEPDGSITHLQPPEYHGDGIREGGIYTFYHFGPDFHQLVLDAGFSRVQAGLCLDPYQGHTSNNHCYGVEEIVPAVVFRAFA